MTRTVTEDSEDEMLALPCGYCGADPGVWCQTTGRRRAAFLHSDRYYAWRAAKGREQQP